MMKKLSKITLLAAATAFLLAGVTACFTSTSDVDDDTTQGSGGTGGSAGGETGTGSPASAKTYDFVGLEASDFLDSTGAAVSAWGNSVSWGAGATVNLPGGTTTVADATVFCKVQEKADKQTLIRARTGNDSKTTALNYNGGASSDISSGVTIDDLDRYVSIPVDGAGTVTATFKGTSSTGKTNTCQVGLFDKNGKLLGTLKTFGAGDGLAETTVTGNVGAETTVYVVMSRNASSDAGGGIDLYKIEVSPAGE